MDTDSDESVQGNMEIEMNSDVELDFGEDQEPPDECNEFQRLVEEANRPLYPGCKSHTKFNALLRLQNLKEKHHMSDAAYSDWVELIWDFLPEGNEIPDTYSDAKKSLLSPKQLGNNIDVHLQPLIDDFKRLWEGVRGVYDATQNQTFTLRGCLLLTINDYPTYGNLSGSIMKGYNACPICVVNTKPTRLVNGGRMSYIGSRRWVGISHPYRRQKAAFNNHTEHSPAPVPLTGEKVLQRVEKEVPKFSSRPSSVVKPPETVTLVPKASPSSLLHCWIGGASSGAAVRDKSSSKTPPVRIRCR
ncbi:hypothetical protein ACLB2K_073780 [Fragaria x ananassa]